MNFQTVRDDFVGTPEGLVRTYEQDFDASYWAGLQWAREEDAKQRCQELWRVASVPAVFVEKWLREGFNIWEETAEAIVARCKSQNLDAFVLTSKRV